jgi:hypothetical protein
VAAPGWATWHLLICFLNATCRPYIGPSMILPHKPSMSSLDTQHLPRASTVPCHVSAFAQSTIHVTLPCVSTISYHVSSMAMSRLQYGPTTSAVRTCHVSTIQTIQSAKFCMFGKAYRMRYLTHMTSV